MSVITDAITRKYGGIHSTKGNEIAYCPVHEEQKRSSRSFTYKETDRLWLKCWAGCSFQSILDVLIDQGICSAEYRSKTEESKDKIFLRFGHTLVGSFGADFDSMEYRLLSIYPYYDENRKLTGFKARFNPKTFRFFTYEGHNLNKARRAGNVPYRFPEMLDALKEGTPIHIFEGEKDADNATAFGIPGAVSFGCATDPLPVEHFPKFANGAAVVWGDNDPPGVKRAGLTALSLYRAGCKVKVVFAPKGKDFSDWKEAGCTMSQVTALLAETPLWLPAADQVEAMQQSGVLPKMDFEPGSEAFVAEIYADRYKRELRYTPAFKNWMCWSGKVWRLDHGGIHQEYAKQLAGILRDKMKLVAQDAREAILKAASKLESDSGRKAVVNTAKTVQCLVLDAMDLDGQAVAHLFNCASGVIDLRTGEVLPHHPDRLITKFSPSEVDFKNLPMRFLQFMSQLFRDDEVVDWMLNVLGYCLTGENSWQHFVLWNGLPGTGKSQLQALLKALMGTYCANIDASSLVATRQRTPGADSDLAATSGARAIFSSELPAEVKFDEANIKALTGGDVIRTKKMHMDKFDLVNQGKLITTSNLEPKFSDDGGIARRLLIVDFKNVFAKTADDIPDIWRKLLEEEGPQILGYLAGRAKMFYENPHVLDVPDSIRQRTDEFLDDVDIVKQWVQACTTFIKGEFATNKRIMDSFQSYTKDNCMVVENQFISSSRLRAGLAKFGYHRATKENQRGWSNMCVKGL